MLLTSACASFQSSLRVVPSAVWDWSSYCFIAVTMFSSRSVAKSPFAATQQAAIMQMKMTRRMLKKVMSMHLFSFQAPQHPRKATKVIKTAMAMNSPAAAENSETLLLIPSQPSPQISDAWFRICRNHGLSARTVIPHPRMTKPRIWQKNLFLILWEKILYLQTPEGWQKIRNIYKCLLAKISPLSVISS